MHYSANGQFINKESFNHCDSYGAKIPRQSQENFTNPQKNKKMYERFEDLSESQIEGKVISAFFHCDISIPVSIFIQGIPFISADTD